MKVYLYTCILLGCVLFAAQANPVAEPEPEPKPVPVKGRRSGHFNEPAAIQFRSANGASDEQLIAADETEKIDNKVTANGKKDASSGRLFLKKFMLFKNMFSGNNKQPVIIVTDAGTGATPPTTTITSTGSIPTATGTITTSPTTDTLTPTTPTTPLTPNTTPDTPDTLVPAPGKRENEDSQPVVLDEEALQAALANGAQEYVVSEPEEIQGTAVAGADTSKASRLPARINLRRKGTRRGQGQTISVRIPPRYRRYFKNGQKVVLNTNNKRRVVKKRVVKRGRRGNKNKKNKNKNRRTRVTLA